MYCMASVGLQLKRGGSPSTISITMIPSDHTSTWRGREERDGKRKRERGREWEGREGGKGEENSVKTQILQTKQTLQ